MKIIQIDAYQVTCKISEIYRISRGRSISSLTSTIVKISTDEGFKGFGEVCPFGSAYMDAYARGVISGIEELGPALLGQDPCQIKVINSLMDRTMYGHSFVKSPLDVACWDILGQASNLSLCTLLGGRQVESYPVYWSISTDTPQKLADEVSHYRSLGYSRFQLKLGSDPGEDIMRTKAVLNDLQSRDILVIDGNAGWLTHEAIRVVNALAGEPIYVEQPCSSLEECLVVRQHTQLPMFLCETITGVEPLLRAYEKRTMDGINIKLSRVGGLTKAKQIRDLCETLGLVMTIEDSAGSDITRATVAHLVGSTQPQYFFNSPDFSRFDITVAEDAPKNKKGRLSVPLGPGLGIHIKEAMLGRSALTIK